MTTTITVPTAEELEDRLSGVDRLLTARRWERAAIVFAFTQPAAPGNHQEPAPPKMSILAFAEKGYAGLASRTAVHRYRDAWIHAINEGWTSPVEPGQQVTLPEKDFPAWPKWGRYEKGEIPTDHEDDDLPDRTDSAAANAGNGGRLQGTVKGVYNRRTPEERLFHHLDTAISSLRKMSLDAVHVTLPIPKREKVFLKIGEIEKWTQETLSIMSPVPDRPDPDWGDDDAAEATG